MKKISTIVPVFNEMANVPLMYNALCDVAKILTNYEFEFVFVNDGSKDDSWTELKKLAEIDSRIVSVDFSRNFGKEIALSAGAEVCTGDAAIFLDADLQHPPALIPEFVKKWENGAEVVASKRIFTEKKSFIKDLGSRFFYYIINHYGHVRITPNATDFKLIDRKVINEIVRFSEHKRMFRGLIEWLGFKTEYIDFVAPARANGEATYSFKKLLSLAVNTMVGNSLFPLKLFAYLGVLLSVFSFGLLCVMTVATYCLHSDYFSSISFVIVTNTLVLGIILVSIGLLAIYIGQIQVEVMDRPLYVIREKISHNEKTGEKVDD